MAVVGSSYKDYFAGRGVYVGDSGYGGVSGSGWEVDQVGERVLAELGNQPVAVNRNVGSVVGQVMKPSSATGKYNIFM